MKIIWLGPERGALTDWITQLWVRITGRTTTLEEVPWLEGAVGKTTGIGRDYFLRLASEQGYSIEHGGGLIRFSDLRGPSFDDLAVHPAVRFFYENTADYELESWAEWCGIFRPFGRLLAILFSRRLQQLNVPLDSLETSGGTTSEVLHLKDQRTGETVLTAWIRLLSRTGNVLYAGSYSTVRIPRHPDPCVKVVFPLPNGNAVVIMKTSLGDDGSLLLTSSGRHIGDPGFYFTVHRDDGRISIRYVRTMKETIHVYPSNQTGEVRTDHVLRIWGTVFLRLHYRLRPLRPRRIQQTPPSPHPDPQ